MLNSVLIGEVARSGVSARMLRHCDAVAGLRHQMRPGPALMTRSPQPGRGLGYNPVAAGSFYGIASGRLPHCNPETNQQRVG